MLIVVAFFPASAPFVLAPPAGDEVDRENPDDQNRNDESGFHRPEQCSRGSADDQPSSRSHLRLTDLASFLPAFVPVRINRALIEGANGSRSEIPPATASSARGSCRTPACAPDSAP